MALGGFIGSDPATTPAQIARWVSQGTVRYFLTGGGFGGFGGFGGGTASSSMGIVRTTCTSVNDTAVPAQYRSQLYDCRGKGPELAAAAARLEAGTG